MIKKFILALLFLNFSLPTKLCFNEVATSILNSAIAEQSHKCCKGEKTKRESPGTYFEKAALSCCAENCVCTSQFLIRLEILEAGSTEIYCIDFPKQIYTKIFLKDIFYPPKASV